MKVIKNFSVFISNRSPPSCFKFFKDDYCDFFPLQLLVIACQAFAAFCVEVEDGI
jgi:hypothetical protein